MRKGQGYEHKSFNFLVVNKMTIWRDADAIAQIGIALAIPTTDVVHVRRPGRRFHASVI